MKSGVASENKNMYLKINIFILTVFINQTSTLPLRPVLNTTFLLYIFFFHEESLLPFPLVFNLTIYFTQRHNNKNENWKFTKQIATKVLFLWILTKLNLRTFSTLPIKSINWKISQPSSKSTLFRWWDLLPNTYTTFLNNDFCCNSHY